MSNSFGASLPYNAPSWLSPVSRDVIPTERLSFGRFPTPIHELKMPNTEDFGLECFIKRDDLSSFDLSCNKVRKLEFLLAEAKNSGRNYDCVITIGGVQSNQHRVTAVAARQVGLESYLIMVKALPADASDVEEEIGLSVNLVFNRMVGANIRLVDPSIIAALGMPKVCEQLAEELRVQGRNPYIIPLGGSNALGTFGHLECVDEIIAAGIDFDHIVLSQGSGSSAIGVALGVKLAGLKAQVHAIGVARSPELFYQQTAETAEELGLTADTLGLIKDLLHIYDGQGLGYGRSTDEELAYIIKVAQTTGIILDPVYSGKGLYYFVNHVLPAHKEEFLPGQKVLFIHSGGALAHYAKESELVRLLPAGKVSRITLKD